MQDQYSTGLLYSKKVFLTKVRAPKPLPLHTSVIQYMSSSSRKSNIPSVWSGTSGGIAFSGTDLLLLLRALRLRMAVTVLRLSTAGGQAIAEVSLAVADLADPSPVGM